MSCYYPMIGLPSGQLTKNGKPHLLIRSTSQLGIHNFENWKSNWSKTHNNLEPVLIPCKKCIGCRLDYSRQWADRCMLELQDHDIAYFVTLTYDDEHLKNKYGKKIEENEHASLFKKDWQDFAKRLRKHYEDDKIRFFMCGEYGTKTFRPHYHAILFGVHILDLVFYKRTSNGDMLYNSPTIDSIWSNGYVVIGNVTWDTCAYTARYCCKKAGEIDYLSKTWNVNPEFTLCSRKPGIGRKYYEQHKDTIFKYGSINIVTEKGGREISPPKYFNDLFAIDNPELSDLIKKRKQSSASGRNIYLFNQTDMNDLDRLDKDASVKEDTIKILRRNEI